MISHSPHLLSVVVSAILTLALANCVAEHGDPVVQSKQEARSEFITLKKKWKDETQGLRLLSTIIVEDYWKGPAAHELIGMGKRALPFVLEEIEAGNFYFNVAASRTTGLDLSSENEKYDERKHSKRWLEWWAINGNNPQWNTFSGH